MQIKWQEPNGRKTISVAGETSRTYENFVLLRKEKFANRIALRGYAGNMRVRLNNKYVYYITASKFRNMVNLHANADGKLYWYSKSII